MAKATITELARGRVSAWEYRCHAGRHARPFVEMHDSFTVAVVRRGTFAYHAQGVRHELVPGSLLLGAPGAEYTCSHEHACGDVCVSFAIDADLLDDIGAFVVGTVPPRAEHMVLGAAAQAGIDGEADVSFEEIGLELAARVLRVVPRAATPVERKRSVRAAELITARAHEALDLDTLAADAGISPFHFLRAFRRVVGVTPHQYLVRTRLERAARLLAGDMGEQSIADVALAVGFGDVSGFNRAFRRAAGMSPRAFRRRRST